MDIDDENLSRVFADMREKTRRTEGRRLLREARQHALQISKEVDELRVAPGGVLAAVDQRFDSTQTFQPSNMILTQLRLASHYLQAADQGGLRLGKWQYPTLSSFVVLRAAIECTASAHWLLSGANHRESVERALRRMWWDAVSAAEMATTADVDADHSALHDLEERINEILRPVKGLTLGQIVGSKRMSLSTVVADAGAALRPNDPTLMSAGWMMCSGIAHGNIPVSAGAGVTVALIQQPSQHVIDDSSYAFIFAGIVQDLDATVQLFKRRAVEQHKHRNPAAN